MRLLVLFLSLIFSTSLFADTIDNALKAQDANSNIESSVDSGFYNKASEANSKVRTKAMEIESARAEEWRRAGSGSDYSSSSGSDSNSKSSSRSSGEAGIYTWDCEFLCGKNRNSVTVQGSNLSEARDNTVKYAKSRCWDLSHAFYESMWGRLADCSKR